MSPRWKAVVFTAIHFVIEESGRIATMILFPRIKPAATFRRLKP